MRGSMLAAAGMALVMLVAGGGCAYRNAEQPKADSFLAQPAESIVRRLRPGHPRLIVLDDDLQRIRELIKTDPLAGKLHDALRKQCQAIVARWNKESKEPVASLSDDNPRSQWEATLVCTLAAMYRLDGDEEFADTAIAIMLRTSAIPDWEPDAFLNIGKITPSLAMGYDWLYSRMTPPQRAIIRHALVHQALEEGLASFRGAHWWPFVDFNWNEVCNSGLAITAMAIGDEEPEICDKILRLSRASIEPAMLTFAPDGGNSEGPGYWSLATNYISYYLAACHSALGDDSLKELPGLKDTGLFRMYITGPFGRMFDFADSREPVLPSPQLFWMSRAYGDQVYDHVYAAWERSLAADFLVKFPREPEVWDLLWFDPRGKMPEECGLPTDHAFYNADIASMRSAWGDKNAVYIAFKGGDNESNHSHLDLGTFVLDAIGRRWVTALGTDNYKLPGYFAVHGGRYDYYRLRTEGQNTIIIDGENQEQHAKGHIIGFASTPARSTVVADLTEAYPLKLQRWQRGIAMYKQSPDGQPLARPVVLVQDEVTATQPVEIGWNIQTYASVTISADGRHALLTRGQQQMEVTLTAPADGLFERRDVRLEKPQMPTQGVTRLSVILPGKRTAATIGVIFQAVGGAATTQPAERTADIMAPLSQWPDK